MKEILKGKLIVVLAVFLAVCIVASTVMSVCSLASIGNAQDGIRCTQ